MSDVSFPTVKSIRELVEMMRKRVQEVPLILGFGNLDPKPRFRAETNGQST